MIPTDSILIAYVDGGLDGAARAEVELVMQADPAVAARVQQFMAARRQGAYASMPEAPRPPRLRDASRESPEPARPIPPRPKIVHLDSARLARRQPLPAAANAAVAAGRPSPSQWAALAATLFVGIASGILAVTGYHSETQFAAVNGNGLLRAHGKLDAALSDQLGGSGQPRGSLRIGVSFVSRDGQYCRAFELGAASGLACRAGAGWNIPVLVEGEGAAGGYRQVGSPLPAAVLAAIDARAVGPALDGKAEKAAAARGWSR